MKNYYIAVVLLLAILVIIGVATSATGSAISVTANFGEEVKLELGKAASVEGYEVTVLNRALDPADYITFSICKGSECKSTSLRPDQSSEMIVASKNLKLELKSVMPRKSATFVLTDLNAPAQPKITTTVPEEKPKGTAPTEAPADNAEKAQPNIIQAFFNWLKSLFGY